MSDWDWTEQPLSISLGRVASAEIGGDSLYLVRHRDLASFRLEGDTATPWHAPLDADARLSVDERNLQVAFDPEGTAYALLADGSVWRRRREGPFEMLSPPDLRAAGHYAHRVGFVWDETGARLVLVGGDHRNDAYALVPGVGGLVSLPYGPGHGVGQTLATRHGVYRLVDEELWLLRGHDWALVGRRDARSDEGTLLFWDPKRDALFFVTEPLDQRTVPRSVQMTLTGPTDALRMPGTMKGPLEAHASVAGIDPGSDRLWCVEPHGARTLRLADLQLEQGSPVVPLAHHERRIVVSPPAHWFREARALRQRDEEAPPIDVPVRDGWVLVAALPISPMLPVGESGTVLLFAREVPYDYDPWTLGHLNAFEVRIVDESYPLSAGGLLLQEIPFRQIEPIYAQRVDTAPDGGTHLARGSKIGGFPALVAGTREDAANAFVADLRCEDCDARLRFVAQLAWPEFDLISAVIYVYACPFGHSGAAHAMNV